MSITAGQLSKTGARGKDIDTIVREHLQIIDDKLLRAERTWGRNVVTYDLPSNLGLPGLDKRDAQRIIYSSIVKSLQKRGFEVRILLETEQTVLYIAWVTELNVEEIEAMNRLIRDVRISRADLKIFLQKGTSAARGRPSAPATDGKKPAERKVRPPTAPPLPDWAAGGGATPPPPPRAAVAATAANTIRPPQAPTVATHT